MSRKISHKELLRLFIYDPQTGIFTRLVKRGKEIVGSQPGCKCTHFGYWKININKKTYLAHRLAWFYVHGKWPKDQIDHANGNGLDNRIVNLRESTQQQNMLNKATYNKHGLKGIAFLTRKNLKKPWQACIHIDSKRTHIGCYATKEEAHAAYLAAAQAHHGEFFYNGARR